VDILGLAKSNDEVKVLCRESEGRIGEIKVAVGGLNTGEFREEWDSPLIRSPGLYVIQTIILSTYQL
jgi:hypothetical protein